MATCPVVKIASFRDNSAVAADQKKDHLRQGNKAAMRKGEKASRFGVSKYCTMDSVERLHSAMRCCEESVSCMIKGHQLSFVDCEPSVQLMLSTSPHDLACAVTLYS